MGGYANLGLLFLCGLLFADSEARPSRRDLVVQNLDDLKKVDGNSKDLELIENKIHELEAAANIESVGSAQNKNLGGLSLYNLQGESHQEDSRQDLNDEVCLLKSGGPCSSDDDCNVKANCGLWCQNINDQNDTGESIGTCYLAAGFSAMDFKK